MKMFKKEMVKHPCDKLCSQSDESIELFTADTEDIAVCLDQSVPGKKSKPTKKMAADEEEERRSLLRYPVTV